MAERGSFGLGPRLDFQQLMVEAQHRWLRPAEICEILRNYQKFRITPEPPNRPSSGSLFLFDRKVLRYFRKDGHNWRKKKDGKTVKEAHEKLKVGSIDVLHCYYAHGEDNENFQRRSYWLLEPDYMHIVFVHYLEVKGNKTNIGGIRASSEVISKFQDNSLSSGRRTNHSTTNSGNTDSTSPTSSLTSLCEDADSGDVHRANPRSQSFIEVSHAKNGSLVDNTPAGPSSHLMLPSLGNPEGLPSIPGTANMSFVQGNRFSYEDGRTYTNECQRVNNAESWGHPWGQCSTGPTAIPSHLSKSYPEPPSRGIVSEQEYMLSGKLPSEVKAGRHDSGDFPFINSNWQLSFENNQVQLPKWPVDQTLNSGFAYDLGPELSEQSTHDSTLQNSPEAYYSFDQQSEQSALGISESQWFADLSSDTSFTGEGNGNYARKLLLEGDEGLQKVDSFSRWISKELGDVEDLHVQSTSDISWSAVECGNVNNESSLSPSISQDQLFSIIDFSPKWAYTDSETEVFIVGTFLKSQSEVEKCNWSCMFGELEVPAKVLADGVLCCHVPLHEAGQVPFYVTCSNRLACSEVREFEYQEGSPKDLDPTDVYGSDGNELLLCFQLKRLLSLKSVSSHQNAFESPTETREIMMKILSLKDEDDCCQTLEHHSEYELKIQNFEKFMKEKFYSWLLRKVAEDGKGPSVLDDKGQAVIHLTAALGYDWAIKPILAAGVSINFRDNNGWTALHWAAFCGRERTVAVLVSLGAAPGLLTDPSPEYPLGRTPADLASGNGHKGISGFLAETSLTDYFSSLKMKEPNEDRSSENTGESVLTVAERAATPIGDGDEPEVLSLKDSLTAVCNAKQAADRIHLVFRMQSFQRKQVEFGSDEYEDERAISLLASKTRRPGQNNWFAHAAATQIQKKFRGWKKRKEFLIIRERVIKIQAHVRGHQVRKQYKTIIWSVGILEKIILRWRRKGSGLRGFRQDNKDPKPQAVTSKEDDYDFLKDGRKQTEERLQKALTRVKSMVQYPEARDQYRRLLTVVEGIRETKGCDMVLNSPEEGPVGEEDMIDIEPLLDDDAFMSIAFD